MGKICPPKPKGFLSAETKFKYAKMLVCLALFLNVLCWQQILSLIFTLQQSTVWDETTSYIFILLILINLTTPITCAVFDLSGIDLSEQTPFMSTKETHRGHTLLFVIFMRCRTLSRNLTRLPFTSDASNEGIFGTVVFEQHLTL